MGILRALDLMFTVIIGVIIIIPIIAFFTALWCVIPFLICVTWFNIQPISLIVSGIIAFVVVGCAVFISEVIDDNTPAPTSPAIRGMEEFIKQSSQTGALNHTDHWRGDWPGRV